MCVFVSRQEKNANARSAPTALTPVFNKETREIAPACNAHVFYLLFRVWALQLERRFRIRRLSWLHVFFRVPYGKKFSRVKNFVDCLKTALVIFVISWL